MKALTCEMCGSTDLIKDGGVFVCQSCGTKYTVEEAKKMKEALDKAFGTTTNYDPLSADSGDTSSTYSYSGEEAA